MRTSIISHKVMLKRHPKEVGNVIAKLRKGKSVDKNSPIEKIDWKYDFAIGIGGIDDGKVFVCIYAKINRWWTWETINSTPPEVKKIVDKWDKSRGSIHKRPIATI